MFDELKHEVKYFTDITGFESLIMYNTLKVTFSTKRELLKMCHLRYRLRIFLFCRKIMFRSQDIQYFVFLTKP